MKVSEAEIIHALKIHRGIVSKAARSLGINRITIQRRAEGNKRIQKAMEEAREMLKDDAESVMISSLKSRVEVNRMAAAKYLLSTQAKDRGYYTKVDDAKEVNIPVIINYESVKPDKDD